MKSALEKDINNVTVLREPVRGATWEGVAVTIAGALFVVEALCL